jgi:hypothetical protein
VRGKRLKGLEPSTVERGIGAASSERRSAESEPR